MLAARKRSTAPPPDPIGYGAELAALRPGLGQRVVLGQPALGEPTVGEGDVGLAAIAHGASVVISPRLTDNG